MRVKDDLKKILIHKLSHIYGVFCFKLQQKNLDLTNSLVVTSFPKE